MLRSEPDSDGAYSEPQGGPAFVRDRRLLGAGDGDWRFSRTFAMWSAVMSFSSMGNQFYRADLPWAATR